MHLHLSINEILISLSGQELRTIIYFKMKIFNLYLIKTLEEKLQAEYSEEVINRI